MDVRRKLAGYGMWFFLIAAALMISPPEGLSGSVPLSVIYMLLSFVCLEAGAILLLCASLAAPTTVIPTLLLSLVEHLRRVLAVPLLLDLIVGGSPVSAAADLILLGYLVVDMVGILPPSAAIWAIWATVHPYDTVDLSSDDSLETFHVSYETLEHTNEPRSPFPS